MPSRIEDYGLIGDTQTAALVSRDGSIDWLCFPRFDSGACFAALLGTEDHGRWLLAPAGEPRRVERRYREGTLVLETDFETDDGAVTVVEWMPIRDPYPDLARVVIGRRGRVSMRTELTVRFDYGSIVPWVHRIEGGLAAVAGPDALRLVSNVGLRGEDFRTVGDFSVGEGDRAAFVLTWHPSHEKPPAPVDPYRSLSETERWWRSWSDRCTYRGEWREAVVRSLIVLKALTYAPTGGIVAAPTTSLPEQLGGVRNWDYRYCWLRDATLTLLSLIGAGYEEEARAWRDWLVRAVAGKPEEMQIMYGPAGERRLTELELPWLPGYEGAAPARIGNLASKQFQLDVYGELADALYQAALGGLEHDEVAWDVQRAMLDFLESAWDRPDMGIWEVRGPPRQFTHSKVMAWVALDRSVRAAEEFGLDAPVDRWRAVRDQIHREACRRGYDDELGTFVSFYGANWPDASLLMIPLVGFLPASDSRVRGTVEAVIKVLSKDGMVARYVTEEEIDTLPPGEGAFLPCSFWLADNLLLQGRAKEARSLFERLLEIRNDLGLLSEEYDVGQERLVGNYPQAFTHVALINTAGNLSAGGPITRRHGRK